MKTCQAIVCKYVNLSTFSFLRNLSSNNYSSVGATVVNPLGVAEFQGFVFLKRIIP